MSDYRDSRWYPLAKRLSDELSEDHIMGAYRRMVYMAEAVERELAGSMRPVDLCTCDGTRTDPECPGCKLGKATRPVEPEGEK